MEINSPSAFLQLTPLDFESGKILLFDKPLYWTSFDVVKKVKFMVEALGASKKLKVGHAGTLDPMASGLMIICTGKATKQIDSLMGLTKKYTGTLRLGGTTQSFDLEMPIEQVADTSGVDEAQILAAVATLTGDIEQYPPMLSAIKIDGKRAYEVARSGGDAEIKSRKVTVSSFDVKCENLPEIDYAITCSKGTYIRSLARDLGEELGVKAYLKSLRRTHIGDFDVAEAFQPIPLVLAARQSGLDGF